jgi:S1-C subfamily serine protease
MQKNNEELNKAAEDIRKEESYGGFQYKHNYDEYKKELIEKQVKKQGRRLNVLIFIGFAVLLSALAVLITDTVLKTKGSSFAELFSGSSAASSIPHKSELSEKAIGDLSSRYTVTVDADGKTGAGIVITEDGYIATSYSLLKTASSVNVTVKNGSVMKAALTGYDEAYDTAVLKVEPSADLVAAEIGLSRTLEPGQNVYCVTSPFSSLLKMSVTGSDDGLYIITEPGCDVCGSPLLNSYGQVVGLCSDRSGRVIHMDSIMTSIKKMLNGSSASITVSDAPVYISILDVYVEAVTEKQAKIYKIPVGCFVTSAHDSHQFKRGDIITEVNNKPVTDPDLLSSALSDGAVIRLYRNNSYIELTLE